MQKLLFIVICFCVLIIATGYGSILRDSSKANSFMPGQKITDVRIAELFLLKAIKIENNDPGLSEIIARKVLLYAMADKLPHLRIQAQFQIANILVTRTKYAEAMKVAIQIRELSEKLDDENGLAYYYEIAGKIKTYTGDYDQSLEDLYKALNYFDKCKDMPGRCRVFISIGTVHLRQMRSVQAMKSCTQALAISILIRDTILQAKSLNSMGVVMNARKDLTNALKMFSKALFLNTKVGLNAQIAANQMNLGTIYLQMGNYNEARDNFQKALPVFRKFENFINLTLCYVNLGLYYEAMGDKQNYLLSVRTALMIARQYELKGIELGIVSKLQDIFQENNMIDSAYKYSIFKSKINESIEKANAATYLSIAELQYQYDNKINEQKISRQRQTLVTLVIVVMLISGIIISMLMVARQRQKNRVVALENMTITLENQTINLEKKILTDELEFKNKELTLHVMNLLKRNASIIDTSRRLMDIRYDQPNETLKDEVIKIVKSLQSETDKEIWNEFELRFKEVHSGFYDRLLAGFPDLTPNDLKICGLLRLNLTTKEISDLTGQRRETMEMTRFRIRKHLGLSDPQINLV
ncbi:MAG: tetratricopeptide repeat protein, partial [Bacteroidetes bacterium]|nr:tetratricopeptide repeat protein [Bacteroidota bacterium]